jgi:uncharacterized protein (TIGR04255 family)
MNPTRKYPNPPLTEIICDFRFKVKNENDLTIHGLLFEKLSKKYPIKEDVQPSSIDVDVFSKDLQRMMMAKLFGMQYKSNDGKEFIRVSPNFISIHRLFPYPTWEAFLPSIENIFVTFKNTVNPIGLTGIALRYIDKIDIPSTSFDLKEYFQIYPYTSEEISKVINKYSVNVNILYYDSRDRLTIKVYNARKSPENKTSIMMDWNYILVDPSKISIDSSIDWVNTAHEKIVLIFEQSITEKCRNLFE